MPEHKVMDATGDSCHKFKTDDAAGVAEAEKRFMELTGSGFTAARVDGKGDQTITREFDPEDNVIFFPALQGG